MRHRTFPWRIARRCGVFAVTLFFMAGVGASRETQARASTVVSCTSGGSAEQVISDDEVESDISVGFSITGGTSSTSLNPGVPQTLTIGSSGLSLDTDGNSAVSQTGLTITEPFTINGVTRTLTQADDLQGGYSSPYDASVTVYAGLAVTFDLGTKGQVDVTPQAYSYDLVNNPTPPGYQYTLLLRAPASPPASVKTGPSTVTYPATSTGTVTLNAPAPTGGENVILTSSSPAVTVPVSVPVAAGVTTITFPITAGRVDTNTPVTLTATAEQKSVMTVFTVLTRPEITFPYALADLPNMHYSDPSGAAVDFSITGGTGSVALALGIPYTIDIGTYNLSPDPQLDSSLYVTGVPFSRPLTLGGMTQSFAQQIVNITLTDDGFSDISFYADLSAATQLVYDFGATGVVTVTTPEFTENAASDNTPIPVTFELLPPYPTPTALLVSPSALYGGATSYGRVSIALPAPTGGATLALFSSDPSAASVPASVTIASGKTSVTFPLTTYAVSADTPVSILAQTPNGRSAMGSLTVLARYALSGYVFSATGPLAGAKVTATSTGTFTLTATATPNAPIPDNNLAGVSSTLSPAGSGPISSIIIGVDITHPHIGDLMLTLTNPTGTSVVLQVPSTSSAQNLDTSFPVLKSSYQSLSPLIGKNVQGVWTLKVADTKAGNVGTLNAWNLTFLYDGTQTVSSLSASDGTYAISGLKESTYGVSASKTGFTFSPSSQSVTVGPDVTPSSPTDIDFFAM